MSIKLQKETISLGDMLCTKYGQTMVESDVIVPDIKPDILKVLQISGDVVITQKSIQQDRAYVQGVVRLTILYAPDGDVIGNIKSMNASQEFSHTIEAPGAKPGMQLLADADADSIDYSLINSRKINIRGAVGINAKIVVPTEVSIATDIESEEPIQIRTSRLRTSNTAGEAERDIMLREQLEVPAGKPSIGEILKCDAKATSMELRMIENKAVVKGEVKVSTLYTGEDEEGSTQFMEHTVPFTEILEIDGLTEGMQGDVTYTVKEIYPNLAEDSDGERRYIGLELVLCAAVRGYELLEIEAIEDAYALDGEITIKRNSCNMEQLIDNVTAQIAHKETAEIPDYLPEVYQVCDCASTAKVNNITIEDGQIIVNGTATTNILYLSNDANSPLSGFNHNSEFTHTFSVPGADNMTICDAKAEVDHISYTIGAGKEIELRFIINLAVKALRAGRLDLIEEIDWTAETDRPPLPSIVIYFVQPGDTLWDIAKRYRTTPDAIIAANGLESDLIVPGQQIKIYR